MILAVLDGPDIQLENQDDGKPARRRRDLWRDPLTPALSEMRKGRARRW